MNEYNKTDLQIESKLVVTSGAMGGDRGKIGKWDKRQKLLGIK